MYKLAVDINVSHHDPDCYWCCNSIPLSSPLSPHIICTGTLTEGGMLDNNLLHCHKQYTNRHIYDPCHVWCTLTFNNLITKSIDSLSVYINNYCDWPSTYLIHCRVQRKKSRFSTEIFCEIWRNKLNDSCIKTL